MAAVNTALMGQVRAGDHVVASKQLFGSCRYIVEDHLPRYGVTSTLVDGTDLDQWKKAMQKNTKTCFLESPTNPNLEVLDIAAIAKIAHDAGATLVVDNVFSTPLFQHPLELGADCVVYSATKHIDGQGRCLGGVILGFGKVHHGQCAQADPADRAVAVAVQCLGAAQGPGDAGRARAQADRQCGSGRGRAGGAIQGDAADLSGPARSPAGRHHPPADEGRLEPRRVRDRRAARRARSNSRTRSSS